MMVEVDLMTVFLGLATVILTAVTTIAVAYLNRKPPKVALQEQINTAFGALVEGYKANIDALTMRVDSMATMIEAQSLKLESQSGLIREQAGEIHELNEHVDKLTKLLEGLGVKAPPRPLRKLKPAHSIST